MPEDWSQEEVEATVSDYFEMLAMELRSEPYNKAEHNRNLQKLLNSRSKGAIEKKHQNISAVLISIGYPYIDGYKPLGNYQQLLCAVVEDRLQHAIGLDQVAARAVQKTVEKLPTIDDLIFVNPPHMDEKKPNSYGHDRPVRPRKGVRRNYLEMESRNRALGSAGEKLILEFERKRLWQAGKKNLADKIEHVAETQGDGLGFDILSFETNGRERLIEVKTTRFGELTPFFVSKSEVDFSETRDAEFQLYRLFKFDQQPKFFILPGSLRKTCSLDAVQFAAQPR
jgi:Protein NO VEIN, C-terminal